MNSNVLKNYKLTREEFRTAYYYALGYGDYKRKIEEISFIGSPNLDGMPRGSSNGDGLINMVEAYSKENSKIKKIESAAEQSESNLVSSNALLFMATNAGCTYNTLIQNKMLFCGHRQFYEKRSEFYWRLYQMIQ